MDEQKKNKLKSKVAKLSILEILQTVENNKGDFKQLEEMLDFILDVMVIMNREILLYIFKNFLKQNTRKDVMKNYFNVIKDEVNNSYKKTFIQHPDQLCCYIYHIQHEIMQEQVIHHYKTGKSSKHLC